MVWSWRRKVPGLMTLEKSWNLPLRPVVCLVVSLLLGICFGAAYELSGGGALRLSTSLVIRSIVITVLLMFLFRFLAIFLLRDAGPEADAFEGSRLALFLSKASERCLCAIAALLLLICWSPYIVLDYPGNIYMDTSSQLIWFSQFLETGDISVFSLRHPPFDSFIFGTIVFGVYAITGSFTLGLFALTLLQVVLSAVALSISAVVARRRWGCSRNVVFLFLAFLALCPLVPLAAIGVSKDAFFSWLFVLFMALYIDIVLIERATMSRRRLVLLCVLSVLLCLTKKLGIYVVVPALALLPLLHRRTEGASARLFVPLVLCVCLCGIAVPGLEKAANMGADGPQEMLAVPLQQSALTIIRHEDEMSEDELAVLGKVIKLDSVQTDYRPNNADGVKGYNPRTDRKGYVEYLSLWFCQGMRYPKDYLDAWISLESPLLISPVVPLLNSEHVDRSEWLPADWWHKGSGASLIEGMYQWVLGLPVVNVLVYAFPYALLVPAFLFLVVVSAGRLRYAALLVPVAASLAGLVLAPIAGANFEATRYLIPFLYTAPLILLACQKIMKIGDCSLHRKAEANDA